MKQPETTGNSSDSTKGAVTMLKRARAPLGSVPFQTFLKVKALPHKACDTGPCMRMQRPHRSLKLTKSSHSRNFVAELVC